MSRDNEITWQKKLLANLPPPAILAKPKIAHIW